MKKGPKDQDLSRRDFLKRTAVGAAVVAGAGLAGCRKTDAAPQGPDRSAAADPTQPKKKPAAPAEDQSGKTKVVLVRDEAVLDEKGAVRPAIIAAMLDRGVAALLGEEKPERAWDRLIQAEDTVGIKTNVWRFIPTPPALEEALRKRVLRCGVDERRIAIDDRGVREDPVFAAATALINVRTLRTHHWAGIGSCLKNYIMFHPEPWTWHDDSCAKLAGLWEMPVVRGKTRLNIQVALTPLFHGKGPHHYQAEYTWPYKGLILGQDPVAVDATAVRLLEAKRREHFGATRPFAVPPKHIQIAQDEFKLGTADPDRIELVTLGPEAGRLI